MSAYTISETAVADGGSVVLSNGGAISTTLAAASGTGTYTLDLPTAPGSATALLKTNGTDAASFKVSKPLMWIVRDTRPSNQAGGVIFSGTWTKTSFLNQVVSTPGDNGEVTLNTGNQRFTISEGTYYILVSLPISDGGSTSTYQGRLYNVSLGTYTYGTIGFMTASSTCPIFIPELVTIPAGSSYSYEVQVRPTSNVTWGEPISGTGTVMEQIKILKLSP